LLYRCAGNPDADLKAACAKYSREFREASGVNLSVAHIRKGTGRRSSAEPPSWLANERTERARYRELRLAAIQQWRPLQQVLDEVGAVDCAD
jgi:hypothetical protein